MNSLTVNLLSSMLNQLNLDDFFEMDNLPEELIAIILNQLGLHDILNCKLVNRRFYSIIANRVEIKDELIISDSDYLPINKKWFHTNQFVNLSNAIKSDCFYQTKFLLNQPIISNLLQQIYVHKLYITVDLLNRFQRLHELKIVNSNILNDSDLLKLCNLKTLCIEELNIENRNLIFDLPNLQKLRINGLYCIERKTPHSHNEEDEENVDPFKLPYNFTRCICLGFDINSKLNLKDAKNLIYTELSSLFTGNNFIESAVNLEHLYCDFIYLDDLSKNLLQRLPKLQLISFNGEKDTFNELRRQKQQFNANLNIYYCYVNSSRPPDFENYGQLSDELLEHCSRNNDRLIDRIPFIDFINYNDLERHFNRNSSSFLRKFNLDSLIVNGKINDGGQLINALKECKTITKLKLYSGLGQFFF